MEKLAFLFISNTQQIYHNKKKTFMALLLYSIMMILMKNVQQEISV